MAPSEPQPKPEESELFFGTTSTQRRLIRAAEAEARETTELTGEEAERLDHTRRRRRPSRRHQTARTRRLTPSGRQPRAG